jgi:putative glycerol-1-phosphate prenyltransferase
MTNNGVFEQMSAAQKNGTKQLAVLLDPDKWTDQDGAYLVQLAAEAGVHYFFVGSSIITSSVSDALIQTLRQWAPNIPVVLFPGNATHLHSNADAVLLLSLISGRNPDFLIGQHVIAAPYLARSPLEVISTGYILVDGGTNTSVQYMSNTQPIPAQKNDIAVATALAGVLLGMKTVYLEAGSGALQPVHPAMIQAVRQSVAVPLIVGGGIRSAAQAATAFEAGADILVLGNVLEKDPEVLHQIAAIR